MLKIIFLHWLHILIIYLFFQKKAEDFCAFLIQSHQNTSTDKEWTIHINVLSGTRAKQSDFREGSHTPMHHTQCGLCEFFTSRQRKTSKWQQRSRVVWFSIREFCLQIIDILFPKLFWHTVIKNGSSDWKKLLNQITRIFYLNSER